jgi:hypothetical protein
MDSETLNSFHAALDAPVAATASSRRGPGRHA